MSTPHLSPQWHLTGQVGLVTGAGTTKGIGRSTVIEVSLPLSFFRFCFPNGLFQFASAGASAIYIGDLDISNIDALAATVKEGNSNTKIVGVISMRVLVMASKLCCRRS